MTEYRDWLCRFFADTKEIDFAIKPVVYCKDCIHFRTYDDFYKQYADHNLFLCTGLGEDGFCSLGESKNDGE